MDTAKPNSKLLFTIDVEPRLDRVFDIEYGCWKVKMLVGHDVFLVPNSGMVNIPHPNAMLTAAGPWVVGVPKHRELSEEEIKKLVLT